MIFDRCRNSWGLDAERNQSDYAAQGAAFVDFIVAVLTQHIVERMAKIGALESDAFGDVVDALRGCWRSR